MRTAGDLLASLLSLVGRLVTRALRFSESWLLGRKKARYGLAVTRIIVGLVAFVQLAANWSTRSYTWGPGMAWTSQLGSPASDLPHVWFFSFFDSINESRASFTAGYLLLAALALVIVAGWRTKIVLPIFLCLWVGFIDLNSLVHDQGDNIYRMLLIYLVFADTSSRFSVDALLRSRTPATLRNATRAGARYEPFSNILHNLAIVVVTMHVSFIYMSGALYKAEGQTWQNGYAIFNPLHVMRFSNWPELADFITSLGPLVVALSWGTIVIQMMFLPMLLNRVTRILALMGIFGFHLGIAFFMGLPFFSFAMVAIDSIFIRDATWRKLRTAIRRAWLKHADPPLVDSRPVLDASGLPLPVPKSRVTEKVPEANEPAADLVRL
ncbi:HTTM domain-containing protein [Frondihabitans sp. 762G35]|uniref:HTTM domain-containing protein n=1 Tax=Frondihabitans sp. 762G35 TaxID=1446794 RepID=UPI0013DBBCBF|nr:HTTM domain-containing protein [Frondihabitans sp. 762G35]